MCLCGRIQFLRWKCVLPTAYFCYDWGLSVFGISSIAEMILLLFPTGLRMIFVGNIRYTMGSADVLCVMYH